MSEPTPEPGQVWQENDPRLTRFVLVLRIEPDRVVIGRCDQGGLRHDDRETRAQLRRFNGKRNGYGFVRKVTL